MEENNKENENNSTVSTDDILKETTNTINEVKDQVKGSFKKDELKNIAKDDSNKNFKYAIILAVIWVLADVILLAGRYTFSWNIFKYLLQIIKTAVAPILSILVLSITILVLNKNKSKSLVTIMSVITATKLPIVIASVVSLLKLISSRVTTVTSPFTSLCVVISTVLAYFGAKFLLGEKEDKEFIKKFVIIESIYYIAYIIIGLLEIYI